MDTTTDTLLPPPTARQRWGARLRRLLLEVGFVVLAVMAVGALRGGVALPDVAPDFTAKTMDGREVHLQALRGQPTVLYFWATWCGACKVTSPTVDRYARNHASTHVIGVAMDDPAAIAAYLRDTPRTFTVVAADDALQARYPVRALPTTVVLDAAGKVAWTRQGVLLPWELEWHVP